MYGSDEYDEEPKEERPAYRDRFMKKKEERSHALRVTVAVLIGFALLAAGFVFLIYFARD